MGEAKNIYFTCFKSSSAKATNTSSNIYLYNSDRLYPKYGSYPEFVWHVWKRVYRHSRECSSRRNYISEWKARRLTQIKSESLSSTNAMRHLFAPCWELIDRDHSSNIVTGNFLLIRY